MSKLTHRLKQKALEIIIQRDGYKCFYCNGEFSNNHPPEYEHLDNNRNDSRPENLVLAHHDCNCKKRTFGEYQTRAHDKLFENEKALLASAGTLADTGTTKELTSQQEISKCNNRITKQFLLEHTINDELLLKDAVNAIVDICQDNTDTGSQSAVYRYIDSLSNPYTGKYTLSVNPKGQNIIRRRTEN